MKINLEKKDIFRVFDKFLFVIIFFQIFTFLQSFPIEYYDFYLPNTNPSAMTAAMGGFNSGNTNDSFLPLTNPALLHLIKRNYYTFTFVLPAEKYDEYNSFSDIPANLKNNYFRGLSFQGNKFGICFNVLASDSYKTTDELSFNKNYIDYYMNQYAIGISDSSQAFIYGFTGKVLQGRMVFKSENFLETQNIYLEDEFIDSSAFGYSFDLGLLKKYNLVNIGLSVKDVVSSIKFTGEDIKRIRTRVVLNFDTSSDYSSFGIGINRRWVNSDKAFYNTYYNQIVNLGTEKVRKFGIYRLGLVSQSFKNQDSTLFCMGLGYFYKIAFCEVSIQSRGWKLNESTSMISFTLSE
jgi:hypothetical protein